MDERHNIFGRAFVWDADKDGANRQKHCIRIISARPTEPNEEALYAQ